ncbi:hypothetical protein B0J15DRAFT_514405 [Fusarium solani]|uniref:ferric-chelate reductase (NADPH) n=1 Tax=Fusarium solani TaxID=169388 RepID=A0A9P9GZB0_FUSSL|nr:uncharacterized protein B0J15DRAFT_514405 [Fusarium solani]KAH7248314.1 hypothetical protein B0J15DRAFT_514405 [Fusarium solani]
MVLLYAGPCFSFLADILHIPLRSFKRLHSCAGLLVWLLSIFHTTVLFFTKGTPLLENNKNKWALIAISAICFLILPLHLFAIFLPYELLSLIHTKLPLLVIYCIWCHLPSEAFIPRLYILVSIGVFMLNTVLQTITTLYRNPFCFLWSRLSHQSGVVLVTIYLRKPIKVEPGQYINLWILCSPLSVFQRHPFTIVSCPTRPQSELTLFIKPRRGLTNSFLNLVKYGSTTTIAAFTGPHGRKLPTQEVYYVLLFATDFRIAAVIPYLRVLIDLHHAHKLCINRVHLVWQLSNAGIGHAAQKLLNEALEVDNSQRNYTCRMCSQKHNFHYHRAQVKVGSIPWSDVIREEATLIKNNKPLIITVSIKLRLKDILIRVINSLQTEVSLLFTEY